MKKALIIANMLFASATVFGMVPNDEHENFRNKRKFSQIEENSGERLPDLRELTVNSSDLPSLSLLEPLNFCMLETLKIIDTDPIRDKWNKNMLSSFKRLISKASSTLKELDLSGTGIFRLPKRIKKCKKLEYLDISDTSYLANLPEEVFDLVNLRHLDYGYRKGEESYDDADLTNISKLSNLEYLNLCGRMGIKKISPEIGKLRNLKTLILEGTAINTLPSTIENLTNLCELDLSSCDFTEVPAEIGKLRNLEKLRIDSNYEFKSIPEGVLNLFEDRLIATDKEMKMLKERMNNLKSSLVELRFYADTDDESVSGSSSDSESAESTTDSSEE
ncbi:MAG: leucine-rich repeat domain-containing protein [Alphaproteobacteria bacterium]|nr:leucine-rich repeat domain-containing protein [Alphaproteobacteria bacterium]